MNYSRVLNNLADNLIIIVNSVEKQIADLPEGKIVVSRQFKNGKHYIVYKQYHRSGKYTCITRNEDLIRLLAIKSFYSVYHTFLIELIELLNHAAEASERLDMQKILKELPEEISKYVIFDAGDKSIKTKDEVNRRKIDAMMSEQYEPNNDYQNIRSQRTSDGTLVKSKSELIIYELLLHYNIRFRYEKPIEINGVIYHPDFTIYLPDGRIIYWEHAGMMSKEKYRNRHKTRMAAFESAGIVPWENLIVTYDDKYGTIDTKIIESEIKNKLL